jgi:HEAT repeat protein
MNTKRNRDRLGELAKHVESRIRGDAAHYLGLTGSEQASTYLEPLLNDADADVRAVARESLDLLRR